MLRHLLHSASSPLVRTACASALGSLESADALLDLVEACHDPDERVRMFARWAVMMVDPQGHGIWKFWDFLYLALSLLPTLEKPRQMRLF